ncbi:MAG: ribosome maturation factor RimP [Clostridiales bacterium]|nr:ribosome maturation factor RimP [Clostridiales bacterium]
MANKTEELALRLSEDAAQEVGVYVVDVDYKKAPGASSLCFYIDKEGGVGIDECEAFSRAVEKALDEADPIAENYTLEVSSPGVDRRLVKEREFRYYIGREVDVKLFAAVDGVKEFTGTLRGYENKTASIDCGDRIYKIPVKCAAYIRLSFVF